MEKFIAEVMEANMSNNELFDALKTGLVNGDYTGEEIRDYLLDNDVEIDIDIEEVIAEAEYIMEIHSEYKTNEDELISEEMGSSHYHNDEGGER